MSRTSSTAASSGPVHADVVDPLGLPEQLADLAPVVAREVRAHALAQVRGLADVEGTASCSRGRGTRRAGGAVVGEAELGRLRVRGDAGQREQVVEPEHAEGGGPLEQEVEQVGGGERVVERAVRRLVREAEARSRGCDSRQLGTSSRTRRRASAHVSTHRLRQRRPPGARSAASRKPRSKRTLWPTITVPEELEERREHGLDAGRGMTIASVMPVSTVIDGGIATPGFTRVWNVPRHSPPRSLTAPISVMAQRSTDPPGGLEVDDAERDLRQGRAEVVERALHGGTIRRTGVRAQEHMFGTRVPPVRCPPCHPLGTAAARAGTSPASTW